MKTTDQPPAEDFALKALDGKIHRLSDYRGRVVLVSFWATWCAECVLEMPLIQTLSASFPEKEFIVLAINVDEEPNLVATFVEQHNLTFPVLLEVARSGGFLSGDQISLLEEWRKDPFGWGERHGFPKAG